MAKNILVIILLYLFGCGDKNIVLDYCNDPAAVNSFLDKRTYYLNDLNANSNELSIVKINSLKKNAINQELGNVVQGEINIKGSASTINKHRNTIELTNTDILEYEIDYICKDQSSNKQNLYLVMIPEDLNNLVYNASNFFNQNNQIQFSFSYLIFYEVSNNFSKKLNVKQIENHFKKYSSFIQYVFEDFKINYPRKGISSKNDYKLLKSGVYYVGFISVLSSNTNIISISSSELQSNFVRINFTQKTYENDKCVSYDLSNSF